MFNPSGQYVVKLFVNGTSRGICVDDYLPVNQYDEFICAYSSRGKLWVSLIEKAYLKLHGGYEFMGSNSSRDLYILTGWLPESISFKRDTTETSELWTRVLTGSQANACLITLRTGVIMDEDAVGLVGNHAYAVLEVVEYKGLKMLLIKNPWGHFRWSGKYSYGDSIWTPELKQALGYDNF